MRNLISKKNKVDEKNEKFCIPINLSADTIIHIRPNQTELESPDFLTIPDGLKKTHGEGKGRLETHMFFLWGAV